MKPALAKRSSRFLLGRCAAPLGVSTDLPYTFYEYSEKIWARFDSLNILAPARPRAKRSKKTGVLPDFLRELCPKRLKRCVKANYFVQLALITLKQSKQKAHNSAMRNYGLYQKFIQFLPAKIHCPASR